MKVNKKDIEKWCEALRSGKYKQTRGFLHDSDGYCCLGVACKVFIPQKDLTMSGDGTMLGCTATAQDNAPEWLKGISHKFSYKAGPGLMTLNDNPAYQLTFDEIADCLEAVYIHEVLA